MDNGETVAIAGMVTGIIINMGVLTAVVLAVYYNVRARNKERMALIEKGVDISELYKKKDRKAGFFKFGMILMGIAVGLIFAVIISKVNLFPDVVSYFIGILLFGGLSILYANQLVEKKNMNQ